jgi:hypothetical protein
MRMRRVTAKNRHRKGMKRREDILGLIVVEERFGQADS